MKLTKFLATIALTLGIAGVVSAQQMQAPPQGDQVDQLDQLLDLDENQQQEIRSLLDEAERQLAPKEQEAQALQARLGDYVGPDYDENVIREDASRLGDLTGEITAETVLLQSRIESVFTEEQRQQLDEAIAQQQQQMQDLQNQMQQQEGQPAQPAQ
ncbi:Spy/CpxP family protein refolding chaperone [Halomonas sp. LR3S48]|uniref:Spy/CpxP family protein refolding chaperone n=1 Tax=Halomonadaceae TaxID=28256 RepID=UPI0021E4149D|nr:Spy/CpxP family protein refolding chaperone [Halomonas sp. LR3S48]UYG02131.1 Spy/CpxP family protein refolding chaperone [Halomonas sp. LR3S48]